MTLLGIVLLALIGGWIALEAYSIWLKHKERFPVSAEELRRLKQKIEMIEEENARLRKRIQNLEAVVASADWDRLMEWTRQRAIPSEKPPLLEP